MHPERRDGAGSASFLEGVTRRLAILAPCGWLAWSFLPADARGVEMRDDSRLESTDELVRQVAEAHNATRREAKLSPLKVNAVLARAARAHAEEMAQRDMMTHEGADGSTAAQRVERAGYSYQKTGENVARGQRTSKTVMKSWLESPPHKANILGEFEEIGVGLVVSKEGQPYWCVEFATGWPDLDSISAPRQFLEVLNAERKANGKNVVKENVRLNTVAAREAAHLVKQEQLEEGEDRGEAVVKAVRDSGYIFRSIAQVAAVGQPSARELAGYLLKSDENRAMLLGDYSEAGVGVATNARRVPSWYVLLARPLREPR